MENDKKYIDELSNDEIILIFKNSLDECEEKRFDQLTEFIKESYNVTIANEGVCDKDELIESICKILELDYNDYLSLMVWSVIEL